MQKRDQKQLRNWVRKKLHPLVVLITSLLLGIFMVLVAFVKLPNQVDISNSDAPLANLPPIQRRLTNGQVDFLNKPVIDISGWQIPDNIDYDKLSNEISGVIVRIQHGNSQIADVAIHSNGEDTAFKTHMTQFQRRGIPVAVYAYVSGNSIEAMKEEARSFYARAHAYNPTFWWLDVEENSMADLNTGVQVFREELTSLGARNIGIYSYVPFLDSHNIDVTPFSATWLASYGTNDGYFQGGPETTLTYAIHQYTSRGKLNGYSDFLDLNRINSQEDYEKIFLRK